MGFIFPSQVSCFDRIWESDSLLDPLARDKLKSTLSTLRPSGTTTGDDVTLNLIDHRLYSLVYNKTLVSHFNGKVYRPIPAPLSTDIYTVSPHFMLLPSDVSVSADATSVKFLSYINNLHPIEHLVTYAQLEHLLAGFIPLFERTLTDLHRNNPPVQRIPGRCHYTVWDEPEPPEHSDDEEGWVTYESEMREWSLNRPINLPDVPDAGYSGGLEKRRRFVTLRDRTVQIVVSASEITLVSAEYSFIFEFSHPLAPSASRGPSLHGLFLACGRNAERAYRGLWFSLSVSSELLSTISQHWAELMILQENITGQSIKFRMAVTYPRGFSAGDTGATLRTWGIRDGDSCHQYIGEIFIREGLSVVFPNIYQHSLTPFTLADPSMAGHLTAIWFFLIDPEIKPVISTSVAGPQQKEWIGKALDDNLDTRLPNELIQNILDNVEGLMSQDEAMDYREQFVRETDQFTQASNSYHFCIPFDIWNGPEIL